MRSYQPNINNYQFSKTNILFIALMVITWIVTSSNPNVASYLAMNPSNILQGHIYGLVTYPFVEPSLISILITGYILYSIGGQFELALGKNKYLKLFAITTLSGGLFSLALSVLFSANIVSMGIWGFIMSMFLLYASENPSGEVRFFFVLPMKMITMIYISLGVLILLATVKGQMNLWGQLFAMMVGFSYIKGFKRLTFLIPDTPTAKKIQQKLGIKKKPNLKIIRSQGENYSTPVNNSNRSNPKKDKKVVSIKKPKDKPKV